MQIADTINSFPAIIDVFVFCLGACVGSFLNVCIYRIPKGESIVRPPSHCVCGTPIKGYDNIPILGWFFLRGKARCCGRKISFRYPFVETITALIFLGMWLMLAPLNAVVGMIFASLMIFCTFVDIDTMMLPDAATVGGALLGVGISIAMPQLHDSIIPDAPYFASMVKSLISSVVGLSVGSGLLYWMRLVAEIVFKREAMGEGDVILVGCIGAFCGWQGAIFSIFAGSLIGAILILPIILFVKLLSKFQKDDSTKKMSNGEEEIQEHDASAIPYGPWLAIGGLLYYMLYAPAFDNYLATFSKILFE